MAGEGVSITLDAKGDQAEQAHARYLQLLDKIERKYDQLHQGVQKANRTTENGFARATDGATKLAQTVTGIGSAVDLATKGIQLMNAEMEIAAQRHERIRQRSLDFAAALREAKGNFAPDDTLDVAGFERGIKDIATDTGMDARDVAIAAGAVFAGGPPSNKVGMDVLHQVARMFPSTRDEAGEMGARAIDLMGATGVQDPQALLGFLINAQFGTRIASTRKVGETVVPSVIAGIGRGDSAELAAEMFGTINMGLKDVRGDDTATTMQSLVTQLADFVPKAKGKDDRGEFAVSAQAIADFEAALGPTARVAVLRANADLRRQFQSETSFETKSKAFIEQYLAGTPFAISIERATQGKIDAPGPGQRAYLAQWLAKAEGGVDEGIARQSRRTESNLDAGTTPEEKRLGQTRADLEKTLNRVDLPGPDTVAKFFAMRSFDYTVDPQRPEAEAIEQLNEVLASSARDERIGFGMSVDHKQILLNQIEIFRLSLKEQEETRRLLEEQNRLLREDRPRNAGGNQAPPPLLSDPSRPPGARPASALGR